jgi:hypothetical protein
MIAGQLALIVAASFTGAAIYLGAVELPSQTVLDDRAQLMQWRRSYRRGVRMQAPLSALGFVLGMLTWALEGGWVWALGGALSIAIWPYSILVMLPIIHALQARDPDAAGPETRALVGRFNRLHIVRIGLGLGATLVFFLASLGSTLAS